MALTGGIDEYLAAVTAASPRRYWDRIRKTMSVAGVSNRDYFLFTHTPNAATYSGSARAFTPVNGGGTMSHSGLPFIPNANSGAGRKNFAARWEGKVDAGSTNFLGTFILVDVIGYYPTIDLNTTTNTLTNVNPLPRYTDGKGVRAFLDVTTVLGATGRTATMTYTDQDGNGSATSTFDLPANQPVQTIAANKANTNFPSHFITLASGDSGIRSVQSFNLAVGGMGAGSAGALVLCKPLLEFQITALGTRAVFPENFDPTEHEALGDNVAPSVIYCANAAPSSGVAFEGKITVVEM